MVRAGTVVVIQQDGITALPAPGEYPCNTHKDGARIGHSTMCAINYTVSKASQRPLQVGEKAYLTAIQVKPTELSFTVQTCCSEGGAAPYKAAVSFQFPKGYLDSMKLKDVQDSIGQVFGIDAGAPATAAVNAKPTRSAGAAVPAAPPAEAAPEAAPAPAVTLRLPATYVNAQTSSDQIQLNANHTFTLQEGGQAYHGSFTQNGVGSNSASSSSIPRRPSPSKATSSPTQADNRGFYRAIWRGLACRGYSSERGHCQNGEGRNRRCHYRR